MTASELLAQIKPCDMDHPYIFISYSSQDCTLIYEDVLMFQQLGYNIWLDERNLDKKKDSWKQDALSAITDPDCQLVVFYVSRHSLVSKNCLEELQQTTAEDTVLLHLDPVPFIAVDVEQVGNIVDFSKATRADIMTMTHLTKPEKMDLIKVLGLFTTTFFNSNNERVRVHPKSEPDRKLNYYEEITASFPAYTKVFEPVITPPWLVQEPPKQEEPVPEEPKAEAPKVEEPKAEAPKAKPAGTDYSLADQVAALLSRKTDVLGTMLPDEDPPPAEPPKEEPKDEPKDDDSGSPSLEELIRRRLEADKKK